MEIHVFGDALANISTLSHTISYVCDDVNVSLSKNDRVCTLQSDRWGSRTSTTSHPVSEVLDARSNI